MPADDPTCIAQLAENHYGKSLIRLLRLTRTATHSDIDDWTVEVLLEGHFAPTYELGDNSPCLPTDTMKNTVYALARDSAATSPEAFAHEVAAHLLTRNPLVTAAEVSVASALWRRLDFDGTPDPHTFMHGSAEAQTTRVRHTRNAPPETHAGLRDMVLLKTSNSAFSGFLRDDLTTLPDTRDRLLGTAVRAIWQYLRPPADFPTTRRTVREALLRTFATHASESVQHTLFAMGEAALAATPEIDAIDLTLPNRHYLLADLNRLGRDNPNHIFIPTAEPHGTIHARVVRRSNA